MKFKNDLGKEGVITPKFVNSLVEHVFFNRIPPKATLLPITERISDDALEDFSQARQDYAAALDAYAAELETIEETQNWQQVTTTNGMSGYEAFQKFKHEFNNFRNHGGKFPDTSHFKNDAFREHLNDFVTKQGIQSIFSTKLDEVNEKLHHRVINYILKEEGLEASNEERVSRRKELLQKLPEPICQLHDNGKKSPESLHRKAQTEQNGKFYTVYDVSRALVTVNSPHFMKQLHQNLLHYAEKYGHKVLTKKEKADSLELKKMDGFKQFTTGAFSARVNILIHLEGTNIAVPAEIKIEPEKRRAVEGFLHKPYGAWRDVLDDYGRIKLEKFENNTDRLLQFFKETEEILDDFFFKRSTATQQIANWAGEDGNHIFLPEAFAHLTITRNGNKAAIGYKDSGISTTLAFLKSNKRWEQNINPKQEEALQKALDYCHTGLLRLHQYACHTAMEASTPRMQALYVNAMEAANQKAIDKSKESDEAKAAFNEEHLYPDTWLKAMRDPKEKPKVAEHLEAMKALIKKFDLSEFSAQSPKIG